MAVKTTLEQLESVQATIEAIENGSQSLTSLGKSWTKADLATLYAREERLLNRYKIESNNSLRRVAEF